MVAITGGGASKGIIAVMWQRLREQFDQRRWLSVAVALYLALTMIELLRVSLFDRSVSGAAGVYEWELAPATRGGPLRARLRIEDGGADGAPAPPSGVAAFAASSRRIDLSWIDNSNDEQGFKLQRSTPEGAWATSWIGHDRTAYADEGLRGGRYCYRIRSFNTAGHSLYAYPSPPCVDAQAPIRFRWTSRRARLLEPLAAPVVSILLYAGRPDIDATVIPVNLSVNGHLIEQLLLRESGWHRFTYYLPILIEGEVWQSAQQHRSAAGASSAGARARGDSGLLEDAERGREEHGLQELRPWRKPPASPPVSFGFEVGSTVVPALEVEGAGDARELGVGLAELEWSDRLPEDGVGFYDWEEFVDGRRFRWTRKLASQPLNRAGTAAVFSLRADHPDIEELPVSVSIFWNDRKVGEITLRDRSWQEAQIDVGDGSVAEGVLSLRTDRTWVPAEAGVPTDARTLAVAMTEVEWR